MRSPSLAAINISINISCQRFLRCVCGIRQYRRGPEGKVMPGIFITGVCGFIGSFVAQRALSLGYDVHGASICDIFHTKLITRQRIGSAAGWTESHLAEIRWREVFRR